MWSATGASDAATWLCAEITRQPVRPRCWHSALTTLHWRISSDGSVWVSARLRRRPCACRLKPGLILTLSPHLCSGRAGERRVGSSNDLSSSAVEGSSH